MRLLRAKHHAVERAITSIERYRKSPTKGTISLEYIERRYYWGQKCKINFYEYNDEPVYAEKLLSFCHERGWQIDGDYICEVLTEFNVFDSEKRNMFMRLQVPVKF